MKGLLSTVSRNIQPQIVKHSTQQCVFKSIITKTSLILKSLKRRKEIVSLRTMLAFVE